MYLPVTDHDITESNNIPTIYIHWPSATLTNTLVQKSLDNLEHKYKLKFNRVDSLDSWNRRSPLIQWSTYDAISHELQKIEEKCVLTSSYTIRKALIRKNFLSQSVKFFVAKHGSSILGTCVPKTWHLSLSFADELDDMWSDELWEINELMKETNNGKWWILKPAMSDGGTGLYLFNSKESLQAIFEKFEIENDSEDSVSDSNPVYSSDAWISSMRDFVIQVLQLNYCSPRLCISMSDI